MYLTDYVVLLMQILSETAITMSHHEMVNLSVEVSFCCAGMYSATSERSSLGMAILLVSSIFPSNIISRGELYFVIIVSKITLEVSCRGNSSGDDSGEAGCNSLANTMAVFSTSKSSIPFFMHSHTSNIWNGMQGVAHVVDIVVYEDGDHCKCGIAGTVARRAEMMKL